MSNTSPVPQRLGRWFLINLFISAMICGVSGRYSDPWLWAYIATVAAVSLYPALALDNDLAKERFNPPDAGADRLPLRTERDRRSFATATVAAFEGAFVLARATKSGEPFRHAGRWLSLALVAQTTPKSERKPTSRKRR